MALKTKATSSPVYSMRFFEYGKVQSSYIPFLADNYTRAQQIWVANLNNYLQKREAHVDLHERGAYSEAERFVKKYASVSAYENMIQSETEVKKCHKAATRAGIKIAQFSILVDRRLL